MTADHEESSFTFVDKRHTVQEDSANVDESSITNSDPPKEETQDKPKEGSGSGASEIGKSFSITDHLVTCIELLRQGAWISMGLVADPVTGAINRDMEGARIAIDTIEYIASKLDKKLDPTMQRELKNLLTDLRLNYVEQMNR